MTRRRRLLVITAGAVLALGVAGLVRAKSYSPLQVTAFGPGFGVSPKPGLSDGMLVLRIDGRKHRTGEARIVIRNAGRWPITIDGAPGLFPCPRTPEERAGIGGSCAQLVALRQAPRPLAGGYALSTRPFRPVRVPGHRSVSIWLRFSGSCWGTMRGGSGTFSGIRLHYSYLGVFGRTRMFDWPFGVAFAC